MGSRHLLAEQDELVAEWVCSRIPGMELGEYPYTALGQMDGLGNLVGGVIFNNFTKRDVHVHVAGIGPRWATRYFFGECFRYIFLYLGCRRCTGLVAASNVRAQRFDEGLGFRREGILRAHLRDPSTGEDEDCVIYGMLREECRWLTAGVKQHASAQPHGQAIATLRRSPQVHGPVTAQLRRARG